MAAQDTQSTAPMSTDSRAAEGAPTAQSLSADVQEPPTLAEIRRWPAVVTVARACTAFQISRSYGYELISRREFPANVIKVGGTFRVITASIIDVLVDGSIEKSA